MTAEYSPYQSWVFDTYLFDRDGARARRTGAPSACRPAIPKPGRSAVMLVDYDIYFKQLNSATLIGNAQGGAVLDPRLRRRSSPQPAASPQQCADRPKRAGYSDAGDRVHALANQAAGARSHRYERHASSCRPAARWASAGRSCRTSRGCASAARRPPAASRRRRRPDSTRTRPCRCPARVCCRRTICISSRVRFDDSPTSRSTTLTWDARFALPGAWRVGPRFGVEQLNNPMLGGKQMIYLPQVRGDWTSRRSIFEVIAGYQTDSNGSSSCCPGKPRQVRWISVPYIFPWRTGCASRTYAYPLGFDRGCLPRLRPAVMPAAPTQEILDEQSGNTLLVVAKPLVFARERTDVAAYARDYATLVAVEMDQSGKYSEFLLLYRWSTVDRRMSSPPDPSAGELRILAEGRAHRFDAARANSDKPVAAPGVARAGSWRCRCARLRDRYGDAAVHRLEP